MIWKELVENHKKINEIRLRFLRRLLLSKAGRVAEAFKNMKNIPSRSKDTIDRTKGYKFEKNILAFVLKAIKLSFETFKTQRDDAQVIKKRAVMQLINTTTNSRKRFYSRWLRMTEKQRLINECKRVNNVFSLISFSIKSVADNAFSLSKDSMIKEKYLTKLFGNLSLGI